MFNRHKLNNLALYIYIYTVVWQIWGAEFVQIKMHVPTWLKTNFIGLQSASQFLVFWAGEHRFTVFHIRPDHMLNVKWYRVKVCHVKACLVHPRIPWQSPPWYPRLPDLLPVWNSKISHPMPVGKQIPPSRLPCQMQVGRVPKSLPSTAACHSQSRSYNFKDRAYNLQLDTLVMTQHLAISGNIHKEYQKVVSLDISRLKIWLWCFRSVAVSSCKHVAVLVSFGCTWRLKHFADRSASKPNIYQTSRSDSSTAGEICWFCLLLDFPGACDMTGLHPSVQSSGCLGTCLDNKRWCQCQRNWGYHNPIQIIQGAMLSSA